MSFAIAAGAVVGIGGALISSNAAKKAAKGQQQSADSATALQQEQYDQTRADYKPYRDAGYSSLSKLSTLLGLNSENNFNESAYLAARPDAVSWMQAKAAEGDPRSAYDHYMADGARQQGVFAGEGTADYGALNKRFTGADLANEPGYQFGLDQGTKNLQASAAARGGLYSGATMKALTKYGNDYASTKFNDGYNRFYADQDRTFNRLSGIAGTGQTATGSVVSAGQNFADAASSNLIGAGNARASGYIAQGNALQSGLNGAAYGLQNAFGSRSQIGGAGGAMYRYDDPYQNAGYYGGGEGE